MQRLVVGVICVVLLSTCACEPEFQGTAVTLDALVAQQIVPLIEARKLTGAAVAVVRGEVVQRYFFGETVRGEGLPPDAATFFEMGSVTKTYTAALLAMMVTDGSVALDTEVQDLLPDGIVAPRFGDRGITLGDLASHVSGLPRMATNFQPRSREDPFSHYSIDDLYAFLQGYTLSRAPGSAYVYSNVGVALLGHLLERKAGMPYAQLLQERVLTPLGLTDTALTLSPGQLAHLAAPYAVSDLQPLFCIPPLPAYSWSPGVFSPAAALRTTLDDLVRYTRANLRPEGTALAPVAALLHTPRIQADATQWVGLAWHITREAGEPDVVWHNGETGGYCSFVGFVPARGEAVVLLGNTDASAYTKAAALRILEGLPRVL